MNVLGFDIPGSVLVLGLLTGLTYGVLAVGVVLTHRSSRVVNFAYGEMGAFGAAVLGLGVIRFHVPYWLMFFVALGAAALAGATSEALVVRRFAKAPSIMTVVATLGVAQVLLGLSLALNSGARAGNLFPQPPGLPSFTVGGLLVTPAYTGMLIFTPIIVVILIGFLRWTSLGIALRAAAANPEAARLSGVSAASMGTVAWALAAALAGFVAIFLYPTEGYVTAAAFGPSLLLRALTAAVIARMENIGVALVAGVAVGILEQLLLWNYPTGNLVEVVLFGIILLALLLQRRRDGRREEEGNWAAVAAPAFVAELRGWLRHAGRAVAVAGVVVGAMLPFFISNSTAFSLTEVIAFTIVGLSAGILTGLSGQLSLGQFGFAAVGAAVSALVASHTGNFPLAFLAAGVVGSAAAVAAGAPALRSRGLMMAVTTLAFALMATSWLLQQPWMLGEGLVPGSPALLGRTADTGKTYYFFALGMLVFAFWIAANVRRGGLARVLIAIRDNEDCARSFTLSARARKLQAFGIAGFLAGIGGALFGHSLSDITYAAFPIDYSIRIVAIVAIGGTTTLAGPLFGALYVVGLPLFLPIGDAGLAAATALGWLLLLLYTPSGLPGLVRPLQRWLVARLTPAATSGASATADRAAVDVHADLPDVHIADLERAAALEPQETRILVVEGVSKRYGGVAAVDGVSLSVRTGEIVGLIGANGAGKTTFFELISGFSRADEGRIVYEGRDITHMSPEQRGRHGLIRSFQDARLFPTMTVLDTIAVSYERLVPTRVVDSLFGLARDSSSRTAATRELVHMVGLDVYRNTPIGELSTGCRRMVELACMLALNPRLLLLDEPSSGIAQRETEKLAEVLQGIRTILSATILIIEHDIPLVMGLAHRIMAMEAGRVIGIGSPDVIRHDPAVIDSCLGSSAQAIERSDIASAVVTLV